MGLAAPYNIIQPTLSGDAYVSFMINQAFLKVLTFKDYCELNNIRKPKAKHFKSYINERNAISKQYCYKYQWFNDKGKCIGETYEPKYTLTENDKGVITCKMFLKWINY